MMPHAERDRIMASIQRGRAAMDRMREVQAANMRGLVSIRRVLVTGQAQRQMRKFHMGRRG